jgi:hypothetical protein
MQNLDFQQDSHSHEVNDLEAKIGETKNLEEHLKQNSDTFLTHIGIYGLAFLGIVHSGHYLANNDPSAKLILGWMAIDMGLKAFESFQNYQLHSTALYETTNDRVYYEDKKAFHTTKAKSQTPDI